MMSSIRSDTRYPLTIWSLREQYSSKSCRSPQFAVTLVPHANTKAKKKHMDQTIMIAIRPAVITSNIERLDTLKRRRQKKTMLSLMNPYAAEDSSCDANSICCHGCQRISKQSACEIEFSPPERSSTSADLRSEVPLYLNLWEEGWDMPPHFA